MMNLYDEVIKEEHKLMNMSGAAATFISSKCSWPACDENAIIFRGDMAYELGGGILPAITCQTLTEDKTLVADDEILVLGPDLSDIKADSPYARLVFLRVKEESLGEGDTLYNTIRKIEYTKYHVYPYGYMSRISSANHREPVRVSKAALAEGLSFEKVGNTYLEAYHKHKQVEAVKIVFITDASFDYKALEEQSIRAEQITGALDHIFKDLKMDCSVCNLKPVCDEVDGLRELHFKRK